MKGDLFNNFLELCEKRNHKCITGIYENAHSRVTIWCNIHFCPHTTTFTNYKKSKTGMPCCKRQIQSDCMTIRNNLRYNNSK